MGLRMFGCVGRGLANNLQEGRSSAHIDRKLAVDNDTHAHQAKSVNDIA